MEPGAAFCGNCGLQVSQAPDTPGGQTGHAAPAHQPQLVHPEDQPPTAPAPPLNGSADADTLPAVPTNGKAIASLIIGTLGLVGSLIPLLGFIMGTAAIALGATAKKTMHRKLAVTGIVMGSIVIVLSAGLTAYSIRYQSQASNQAGTQTVFSPCYEVKLDASLKINQSSESCSFNAVSADDQEQYVVKALTIQDLSAANLKQKAEADAANTVNLIPGSQITSSQAGTFANSPAYTVKFLTKDGTVTVASYVYHKFDGGLNMIIVTHANNKDASLDSIERDWNWL